MKCSFLYFLLLRKVMLAVYFPQPPLQFKSHNSLRLKGGCDKSCSIRQFWRGNSWQWKIKRLYKTTTTMMMMMMSRRGTIALQVSLGGRLSSRVSCSARHKARAQTLSAFITGWDPRGQQGPCGRILQDGGDVLGNLGGGAGACWPW